MAAYDLEEQEQLAELKAWWAKYGNMISTVALVVVLALLGWVTWQKYQRSQGEQATAMYAEVFRAASASDAAKLQQAVTQLTKEHPGSLQASLATMIAAKSDQDKNDVKAARVKLEWVVDHASDQLVKDLARMRLAALLLDEKAYDAALKQIDSNATSEFAAHFAELRGDVLVEQGKNDEAKAAYKQASEKYGDTPEGASLKNVVQTKLEALGG